MFCRNLFFPFSRLALSFRVSHSRSPSSIPDLSARSVYYPDHNGKIPTGVDLWITGVGLFGALVGQVFFGFLADKKGRKSMYLITLIIMIVATIGQASAASAVRGFSFAVW